MQSQKCRRKICKSYEFNSIIELFCRSVRLLVIGSKTGTDRTKQHFEEPKPTENRIFKIHKTGNRPKTESQKEVQSIFSGGMK